MTRNEYEDIEGVAVAAMIGLMSHAGLPPEFVAVRAFDMAEAFQEERKKRLGEKPDFANQVS